MFSGTESFKLNFLRLENTSEISNVESPLDTSFSEECKCDNSIFGNGNNKIIGDFFSYEGKKYKKT